MIRGVQAQQRYWRSIVNREEELQEYPKGHDTVNDVPPSALLIHLSTRGLPAR